MSRTRQIRESIDIKLDKLDAQAEALEATLHHAEDQMHGRIERGKQKAESSGEPAQRALSAEPPRVSRTYY